MFYHLELRCYIVVELKATSFKPEYIGQLGFYVTAIDETLKKEIDNPTLGLLLCKEKNKLSVEWSLKGTSLPIGVSSYKLKEYIPRDILDKLPTEEEMNLHIDIESSKEFSKKGYIIDKKRMANGTFFDEDYYDSLLAEIREIRLSERRFYQKITDIYATSVDYDSKSPTTIKFFKKVQNKMHYAVSHQTASEIIYNRADSKKEHMGLTNWLSCTK